jgi:hypothetical protein
MDENSDLGGVLGGGTQQQTRVYTMLQTNFMAAQDPAYAFDDAGPGLSRFSGSAK